MAKDIKEIDLKDLRRQIGVVLQEPYLFSGTIAENIAYAHPDATMEGTLSRQRKAAKRPTNLLSSSQTGYDSEVGERGGTVVRRGNANASPLPERFLHNPRILILGRSHLVCGRGKTEKKIQQAI